MTRYRPFRLSSVGTLSLIVLALSGAIVYAQTVKVEGLIKSRSGATMTLRTSNAADLTVVLTDSTQVGQIQGVLQARRKEMSAAALIPGLAVQVEGTYNDQRELLATVVKFKGNDLEEAQTIQAGLHETQAQAQQNRTELEKQNATLKEQNAALKENKEAIEAATARFGQLDEYYILDEVTVLFGNGKVTVDPKYTPELLKLAEKATTVKGYMIQVKGYASSSGSAALNQKLSEERAANVVNVLLQEGHIPLVNMLAPGAMGESRQVGEENTPEGEAENRRVVVRVLQNKGIAGK